MRHAKTRQITKEIRWKAMENYGTEKRMKTSFGQANLVDILIIVITILITLIIITFFRPH